MDLKNFTPQASGYLVPTVNGVSAFVPNDLPPLIDLNCVGISLAEAMQAIGEL